MNHLEFFALDAGTISWKETYNQHAKGTIFSKDMLKDLETGMSVRLVRYPAGLINPSHTHPCGHGMYVLEGILVTHRGEFGPGSFVWFPEGDVMFHGASAHGDVTVVFITNKPFEIHYTSTSTL